MTSPAAPARLSVMQDDEHRVVYAAALLLERALAKARVEDAQAARYPADAHALVCEVAQVLHDWRGVDGAERISTAQASHRLHELLGVATT